MSQIEKPNLAHPKKKDNLITCSNPVLSQKLKILSDSNVLPMKLRIFAGDMNTHSRKIYDSIKNLTQWTDDKDVSPNI